MKEAIRAFAVCILGVALWATAVGAYAVMAQSTSIVNPDPGTIPPIQPFEKQVSSYLGGSDVAFSNEPVTYTVVIREIITASYRAEILVSDTLPSVLIVDPASITATAGHAVLANGVITWSLTVETGMEPYTLTYVAQASSIVTSELTISNTAYLQEVKNLGDPDKPASGEVLSSTAKLLVRPRYQYLPVIRIDPTPTPLAPLPALANYNFEQEQQGWSEVVQPVGGTPGPGKLIYSITENPVAGVQGNYYAWLGGAKDQINELKQTVILPSGYSDIRLRFIYRIRSQETNCDSDLLQVRVDGKPITVNPESGNKHQLCVTMSTFKSAVTDNLAAHSGTSVEISFWTQLNGTLNSNYFLDVVELCSDEARAPSGTRRCDQP